MSSQLQSQRGLRMQVALPSHYESSLTPTTSPLHVRPLLEHDRIGSRALCSLPARPIRPDEIKRRTKHRQERSISHVAATAITAQEYESGVEAVISAFAGTHHHPCRGAGP